MFGRPNPRLNFYLRLDGSGRVIPSTGVWRLKQPKTGKWVKIDGDESDQCCGTSSTTSD